MLVRPRCLLGVLGAIKYRRNVAQPHRGAVPIGDDQRPVAVASQKLIVRANRESLMRTIESALGLIHVGLPQ